MIHSPVAIFLIVLLIILLGSVVFRKLRIPPIVGMILAGIAVGPFGFNLLERDASFRIFGEVGILYIMFQAAVDIDMFHLKAQWRGGALFGILSFLLPMAGGVFGSHFLLGAPWPTAMLIATMYASHTLITYPVVSRFGLQNLRPAVVAVCGTIIAVLLALLCLAGVVQFAANGAVSARSLLTMLLLMAVFTVVVGYTFPAITRRFFRTTTDTVPQYIFILALVFVASLVAQLIGLEAILGAFYAGLVLNKMIPGRSPLMKNIRFVGDAIFVPYFLIGVGMLINIRAVFQGWSVLWIAANMSGMALLTKWLAAYLTQRFTGMSPTDRLLMFGLSGGKAAATIAAVMIGYNNHLLNEDLMNGAVFMILICCLVASVTTERAAKHLRMALTSQGLEHDDLGPVERARQVVSVANPVTAEGLMRLALFMRSRLNTNAVTALFIRNNDDSRQITMGRNALNEACKVADEMDIEADAVERFDLNVASGISNMVHERNATEVMIGMHRKSSVVDTFYGSVIERLLADCNRMVIMSRCFIPVDTVSRIVVAVPRGAEYETGFHLWVSRLATLAANIEAPLTCMAYAETGRLIRAAIEDDGIEVDVRYETLESWDDFILLSGSVDDDDLLVVIGARKGSISYTSDVEQMPAFLSRHFSRHNLLLLYPKQF